MLSSKKSSWYVSWLLLDIIFYFVCIYFVCTCFFVDKALYLETYTHERRYISSWYHSSLESTVFVLFDSLWLRKEFANECLSYFTTSSCTHIWFGHKLCLSFASYRACEPIFYLCGIFVSCVLGWHVKHYVPYISKTMLMLNAHPCISLTKGLTMSLTQFWLSQFLCLIFSYRSTICLLQVLCFISYLCSLARFWCLKWFWGSEDAMFMHLVFKCNYSNRCINLGELSYFI